MSFNLPNPSLLGIFLIISTHSGPQLVYKYPQNLNDSISSKIPKFKDVNNWDYTDSNSSEDDELYGQQRSEEESDEEEEEFTKRDLFEYSNGNVNSAWDTHHIDYYLGTKLDLLSFLDEQNQRRNYLNRVKKAVAKKKEIPSTNTSSTAGASAIDNTIYGIEPAYLCEMLAPPKKMCNTRFELTIENKVFVGLPIHKYDDGYWRKPNEKHKHVEKEEAQEPEEVPEAVTKEGKPRLSLNMFHVVFVMNPPMIESNYRIDEMFHYVISRLSLVLRYEQSKHDYISDQIKMILTIKDHASEDLQAQLLEKSSLCKLIHDCYNSITTSKIANLLINGKLRSFQIPIKTEFHSLPDSTVPYIPGSYLSSTTDLLRNTGLINIGETSRYGQTFTYKEEEGEEEEEDHLMYFALLLLDEPETIIHDIKTDKQSNLANFVRMVDPRLSLNKLSIRLNLDILQIKSFTYHLIYWRRARIIQPLSTRSIFIVSPMAPISIKLLDDVILFKEKFPTLPSLPHFLKLFSPQSRKPQQFANIIPSKDHRESYLQALAWLVRFGYITQLQTFIWLKISRKIKIKVEEDLENEGLNKKKKRVTTSTDNTFKPTDNTSKKEQKQAAPTQVKSESPVKRNIPTVTLIEEDDTIILDPGRASNLERKWINKIIFEECKLSPELTAVFYKLLKYMNGKSSLELLLLKENISIIELRKLLFEIEDYIISVRHW
ncbi:Nitrogen permease regulator 3 [Spathaspora sp. JA1]|nr:Nitrogen permease regulator 3 [Spathaspora sp. JA1]